MTSGIENTESGRIAHLTMLQGVITRMGSNSFTLKALAATFGSASIVLMTSVEDPSPFIAMAAILPVLVFCFMDAQYLRLERAYRKLFDHVRSGGEIEAYSMDARPFMGDTASVLRLVVSWSVGWFYIPVLVSVGVVAALIFGGFENG